MSTVTNLMRRKEALQIAITALQREYKYWLLVSDSDAGDKMRTKIAQAIEKLDAMKRQREMKL